ncbi:MAG: hypothetical protein NVSMB63_03770 [Sediminibacterium sp.]
MKQLASILLLSVMLFNWGGHRLLTDYLENRSDEQLQAALDQNQYNDEDLVRIKVAASLPYGTSSEQFQRADGNIEINGVNYAYVKRRFYQDSLELLCIPNTARTSIRNARDEFFRLANDFVTYTSSKKTTTPHPHSVKFSVSEFTDDHFFAWQCKADDLAAMRNSRVLADLGAGHLCRLDKPPQAS